MRRLLAILLVLFFGLPLIAPLLAQTAEPEYTLHACCRRNGAHHCAETIGQGTSLSAIPTCPEAFPRAVSPAGHRDLTFAPASLFFADAISHPAVQQQTEARARIALDRSRRKRGPPSSSLA